VCGGSVTLSSIGGYPNGLPPPPPLKQPLLSHYSFSVLTPIRSAPTCRVFRLGLRRPRAAVASRGWRVGCRCGQAALGRRQVRLGWGVSKGLESL
jgi:hypothetical protein